MTEQKRFFNIYLASNPTIEADDHFHAATQWFNFHSAIGMLMIQEMDGPNKIGDPINIGNIFKDHDEEIMRAVEMALKEPSVGTIQIIKDLLLEAKLDRGNGSF